jgi:hypothetical protein
LAAAACTPHSTLQADLDAGWTAIANATVDLPARLRDWHHWTKYCENQGHTNPYLPDCSPVERSTLLVGFAARYRTGDLGRGNRVQGNTVATAVRHVGHMFDLAGYPDPRRPVTGGDDLLLAFSRQLRSYRNNDPSTESQVALPVKLFQNICDNEGQSNAPVDQATSDVITIMFYFLLRVGEITCPAANRARRTVQFRRCDTSFWHKRADGSLVRLPANTPLAQLLLADQVTLKLSNQKNGSRDATLHHEHVDGNFCPVKAVARRFDASRRAAPTNQEAMLCLIAPQQFVVAKHVHQVLQRAAVRTTIWLEGFALDRIGPHSIRASGAMALYLNNVSEKQICILGRWKSKTWLTYIHSQIAAVSAGISRAMARPVVFHNIAVRG